MSIFSTHPAERGILTAYGETALERLQEEISSHERDMIFHVWMDGEPESVIAALRVLFSDASYVSSEIFDNEVWLPRDVPQYVRRPVENIFADVCNNSVTAADIQRKFDQYMIYELESDND